jgi:hypothetical protein
MLPEQLFGWKGTGKCKVNVQSNPANKQEKS